MTRPCLHLIDDKARLVKFPQVYIDLILSSSHRQQCLLVDLPRLDLMLSLSPRQYHPTGLRSVYNSRFKSHSCLERTLHALRLPLQCIFFVPVQVQVKAKLSTSHILPSSSLTSPSMRYYGQSFLGEQRLTTSSSASIKLFCRAVQVHHPWLQCKSNYPGILEGPPTMTNNSIY
jgi:hypothetical protein